MDRNFSSKEDLDAWLASLNPVYKDEGYAEILFCAGGVRSTSMLADARCEDLQQMGLKPIHATHIIKRAAGATGMQAGGAAAGGAGPGPSSVAGAAVTVEVLRAELEVLRAEQAKVLEAVQERTNARKSKGFSSVGASEAEQLLHVLGIPETDGNQLAPITVPEECPTCSGFDYSQYANETAGTAALLQHHQEQLQRMGVTFGRSGYKVYDVHAIKSMFTICSTATEIIYRGGIDGCVGPFGLMSSSAPRQCRIAYEHTQSPKQKQAYRDQHPDQALPKGEAGELGEASVSFTAGCKGRAVVAMIGACAHNDFPLILDLTDGEVHHVLQLQGLELYEWVNLTPRQAYYKQAQLLKDQHALLTQRRLTLEAIPEELQAPVKKLRTLRPASALMEQLESIIPTVEGREERLQATFDLMFEWGRHNSFEMPAAVKAMYG